MTKVIVDVAMDGFSIPGFPWVDESEYRHFFRILNTVTNTSNYVNAIPTLDTGVTYKLGLLIIVPDKSALVTLLDGGASDPITLAAGMALIIGGANVAHSNATPFAQIKATINPTNFLIVAGLR